MKNKSLSLKTLDNKYKKWQDNPDSIKLKNEYEDYFVKFTKEISKLQK